MGYWLINTGGIGGVIVVGVATIVALAFARMVYWIYQGGRVEDEGDARH